MWYRRSRLRTVARDDRGAQAVEFAFILPVLLLIVLGIINFGFAFGQKLSLNQAVREGARLAVVPGIDVANPGDDIDTLGEIRDAVRNSTGGLVDKSLVMVAVEGTAVDGVGGNSGTSGGCKSLSVGDTLNLDATYQARMLIPWLIPGLSNEFSLTAEAAFRCEW